ncbi:hypothetical protein HD554DRAFT_2239249 [Boletus coccyginus]|nr:hypothetical protein HD554DRAFT_2239249 [Boletus coccyginus]
MASGSKKCKKSIDIGNANNAAAIQDMYDQFKNETARYMHQVHHANDSKSDAKITQPGAQSKARHRSTSQEPTAVIQTSEFGKLALYSIPEVDDSDVFELSDPTLANTRFSFTVDPQEGAKEFFSTLGNNAMVSESEGNLASENYGQELDAISSTTNGDLGSESSRTDNAFLQSSLPPLPTAKKKGKAKFTSTCMGGTSMQAHMVQSTYDPQTCPFVIPCVIRKSNSTNFPFDNESDITYEEPCDSVAAKLKCCSPALKLQYCLDPNNTKHAVTSIQSAQELTLFMARICPMLVPPHLANGKPSTCPLKNILVHFEDGSSDNKSANPPNLNAHNPKSGNRMATKASTLGFKQVLSSRTNATEEGATPLQENVEQLQKRYMCKINGVATVNDKPPTLHLQVQATRPCIQMRPSMATGSDQSSLPMFNLPSGYPYPPAPPQVIVLPSPWGGPLQGPAYPGTQGGNGYLNTPFTQPANANTPAPPAIPATVHSSSGDHGPDSSCSTSPTFSNTTTHTSATSLQFSIDDIPFTRIPSMSAWLKSLDDHEEQGKDKIGFARFAPIFEQEGFVRLSQLSGDFISQNELQEMLSVPHGTALSIMQYAKQDLQKLALEVIRATPTS